MFPPLGSIPNSLKISLKVFFEATRVLNSSNGIFQIGLLFILHYFFKCERDSYLKVAAWAGIEPADAFGFKGRVTNYTTREQEMAAPSGIEPESSASRAGIRALYQGAKKELERKGLEPYANRLFNGCGQSLIRLSRSASPRQPRTLSQSCRSITQPR